MFMLSHREIHLSIVIVMQSSLNSPHPSLLHMSNFDSCLCHDQNIHTVRESVLFCPHKSNWLYLWWCHSLKQDCVFLALSCLFETLCNWGLLCFQTKHVWKTQDMVNPTVHKVGNCMKCSQQLFLGPIVSVVFYMALDFKLLLCLFHCPSNYCGLLHWLIWFNSQIAFQSSGVCSLLFF